MFKKLLKLSLLMMLCMFLCSCASGGGSYTSKMSVGNNGSNYFNMSYDSFKGTKYQSVKLKSGDVLALKVEIKTDSGNLKAEVLDKNDNEIYSIENPQDTVSKEIEIKEDGKYKIQVEGEHSGNFHLSWKIK